jgi:deazaflavin-dependent oxidoreductase (nitroreductase family)
MDPLQFNKDLIAEYRANGGQTSGPFKDAPLLLLTTTGRKSGEPRTSPVVFSRDGDDLVVIASKAGAPDHPDWYRNLVANPAVTVELGTQTFEATAVVTEGEERARLYAAQAEKMEAFKEYEAKTTREIPVVRLVRT